MLTFTTPVPDSADEHEVLDDVAADFDELRPRLIGIAARIIGNRSDAEDIVQDAWLRWQLCDRTRVESATAFLVTTATRLALNAAQTARARHERSVGTWSPEPADGGADLARGVERDEALDVGIRILLERLNPVERAAFVLRQAFGYEYSRIAELLATSETNARQLVSRATKHVGTQGRNLHPAHGHPQLLRAFIDAARHGEISALERALVPARAVAA